MSDLITDLEALTNDTPANVRRELNERALSVFGCQFQGKAWKHEIWTEGAWTLAPRPNLLDNLQDAVDALPEGWCGDLDFGQGGRAQIWNGKFAPCTQEFQGIAHNPATALTIANLKRLEQ